MLINPFINEDIIMLKKSNNSFKYRLKYNPQPTKAQKFYKSLIFGRKVGLLVFFFFIIFYNNSLFSQVQKFQKDNYILNETENFLTIVVHIWGEVNRPGEFLVPDGTNVLELISKAGGPTIYSNLGNVVLTRGNFESLRMPLLSVDSSSIDSTPNNSRRFPELLEEKQVIKLNLKEYLEGDSEISPLVLQPGDVIRIKRNIWYKWGSVIRVVSQVAMVVQALYWYNRIGN